MPPWSGKTRGGLSGYKSIVFIIKHAGLATAYFFLYFIVIYFVFTSPKSNKAAFYYFKHIHQYSLIRTILAIFKNYYQFGQTLIDKITMLSGMHQKFTFTFEGEEYLNCMSQKRSGAMLMSAHVGSFEIAGYLLKRIDAKVNILMYEAEHANIKHYLSSIYQNIDTNIIPLRDDLSHIYDIQNAFENKEFLCLHGDRFVNEQKTITKKFMGHNAPFPAGPFYLAMKFNVPVSFVFAVKTSKTHYHFYASEPKVYFRETLNLKKRPEYIEQILDDYIQVLQSTVQKHPYQWYNFYYFWGRNSS